MSQIKQNPASLRWPGPKKPVSVFSLAGFVTRPQAEYQIGATEVGGTLPATPEIVKFAARQSSTFKVPGSLYAVFPRMMSEP